MFFDEFPRFYFDDKFGAVAQLNEEIGDISMRFSINQVFELKWLMQYASYKRKDENLIYESAFQL